MKNWCGGLPAQTGSLREASEGESNHLVGAGLIAVGVSDIGGPTSLSKTH
jgi:hypothetical protein